MKVFYFFILPLITIAFSALLCNFCLKLSAEENAIISILVGVLTAVYSQSYSLTKITDAHKKTHLHLKVSNSDAISELNRVYRAISQIEKLINIEISSSQLHPYFEKQTRLKLENSLLGIKDLLEGNNYTNPHNADTFGIEGLRHTLESGIIKATSVVEDYWEDRFTIDYLNVQEELIVIKNVTIKRIFIFPESKYEKIKPIMEKQKALGIDVCYIFKEYDFVNKEYLKEDYLIQDNKVLVQIFCESHKATNMDDKTEFITTNKTKIQEMNDHFEVLYSRSTRM